MPGEAREISENIMVWVKMPNILEEYSCHDNNEEQSAALPMLPAAVFHVYAWCEPTAP